MTQNQKAKPTLEDPRTLPPTMASALCKPDGCFTEFHHARPHYRDVSLLPKTTPVSRAAGLYPAHLEGTAERCVQQSFLAPPALALVLLLKHLEGLILAEAWQKCCEGAAPDCPVLKPPLERSLRTLTCGHAMERDVLLTGSC